MVKQRFSSADVAAEAACLRQRCLGMRVANVYDINPKVGWARPGAQHLHPQPECAASQLQSSTPLLQALPCLPALHPADIRAEAGSQR